MDHTNRHTKIAADGSVLPVHATVWDAVLDNHTGFMWPVKAIRIPNGHEKTIRAALAETQGCAGFHDWAAPSVEQLFTLPDRTRVNPAIDTNYFPNCPPDWFWSITPDSVSPLDLAWNVNFYYGISNRNNRNNNGWFRAVRVGQL
jgi:hypothetical protein